MTLIEVTVSVLLLSIALAGLAVGFPPSRAAIHTGDRVSTAVHLAQQTMEGMRNREYDEVVDQITPQDFPDENPVPGFPAFRRVVRIRDNVPLANCRPPGSPCSKTVTVTVFYRDEAGQERPVTLTTIFVR